MPEESLPETIVLVVLQDDFVLQDYDTPRLITLSPIDALTETFLPTGVVMVIIEDSIPLEVSRHMERLCEASEDKEVKLYRHEGIGNILSRVSRFLGQTPSAAAINALPKERVRLPAASPT